MIYLTYFTLKEKNNNHAVFLLHLFVEVSLLHCSFSFLADLLTVTDFSTDLLKEPQTISIY